MHGSEGYQHSMQDEAGAWAYPGAALQSRRIAQARPARQPSRTIKPAKAATTDASGEQPLRPGAMPGTAGGLRRGRQARGPAVRPAAGPAGPVRVLGAGMAAGGGGGRARGAGGGFGGTMGGRPSPAISAGPVL